MAAGHSVDPASWRELFDELMSLVAGRFGRVEPRRTAREFVLGLLSPAERKNCWWLAERAGHEDPQAMQRLLRTAAWDAGGVRDDVRGFVTARLGDPGGVLICDETGFLKKGTGSVGVQRQYSGTAGRIENSTRQPGQMSQFWWCSPRRPGQHERGHLRLPGSCPAMAAGVPVERRPVPAGPQACLAGQLTAAGLAARCSAPSHLTGQEHEPGSDRPRQGRE